MLTTITKRDKKTKDVTSYKFVDEKSAVLFCKLCNAVDNKETNRFKRLLNTTVTRELINNINTYIGRKVVFATKWEKKREEAK